MAPVASPEVTHMEFDEITLWGGKFRLSSHATKVIASKMAIIYFILLMIISLVSFKMWP
jgi:hypothetical protein